MALTDTRETRSAKIHALTGVLEDIRATFGSEEYTNVAVSTSIKLIEEHLRTLYNEELQDRFANKEADREALIREIADQL